MAHELPLISILAIGLSLAFFCGLIAVKLRIPPIVGYLLAGVMIGPHTPGFTGNLRIAEEFSEIGVVLLMFGVGLHFSMRDLLATRNIALPGAVVQIAVAMLMGGALAHYFWEWSIPSSAMFGLSLSVASTVVLLRTLETQGMLQSTNGRIAVGWLIVEDLAMVLALILVPALAEAATGGGDGLPTAQRLFEALGKVCLFVAVMMVAGRRVLPWILEIVSATKSRELFTLAVFASAIGLAYGAATLFGVSFALGAFFAGMMIRESDLNHAVADRALPFQDAFAVLFFVSVGMMFDPLTLLNAPGKVLLTTAIIVLGKSLAAFGIVLLFRYSLKAALVISVSLAQIGEFSFVLAALGVAHGILPPEGKDLILASAIISIAINPALFSLSRRAYQAAGKSSRLSAIFNLDEQDLSHLRQGEKQALREPVVLIGHGRVGQYISSHVIDSHINLVIVDNNRDKAIAMRRDGYHVVAGDATVADTLREAAVDKAVAIIVAIPNPFEARQIVELARKMNPAIKVLVRADSDAERRYFIDIGCDLVLMGAREIGRAMTSYINDLRK